MNFHGLHCQEHMFTGEKSSEYNPCGKTVAHYSYFLMQKGVHTGERETPYECTQCGKLLHITVIFKYIKST